MEHIDRLETKVREMIAVVHSLREENGRLKSQVADYESRLSGLSAEQGVIDEERTRLRDRIEAMLADLEALEAGAPAPESAPDAAGDTPGNAEVDTPHGTPPNAAAPDPDVSDLLTQEPDTGAFSLEPQQTGLDADAPENAPAESSSPEDPADAGAQEIDLPDPQAHGAMPGDDGEEEPPARPGSDPAHPVLPGFS